MAQNDVELLIRVRNEASAALDAITESTRDFVEENRNVRRSAEQSDSTLAALRQEYDRLQKTMSGLRSATGIAEEFRKAAEASRAAKEEFRGAANELGRTRQAQQGAAGEVNRLTQAYDRGQSTVARYREDLAQLAATQQRLQQARGLFNQYREQRRELSGLSAQHRELNQALFEGLERRRQLAQRIEAMQSAEKKNGNTLRSLEAQYRRTGQEISRTAAAAFKAQDQYARTQKALEGTVGTLREYGFSIRNIAQQERKRNAAARNVEAVQARLNKELEETQQTTAATRQELRAATQEYDRQTAAVERAQRAAQRAQATQRARAQAANAAAQAAREAGVDTRRLSAAQERLQGEYREAAKAAQTAKQQTEEYRGALRNVERQSRRTAGATRQVADATTIWNDNSRKAMSLIQRFRGELLALGAAWVGLYGAINQTRQAFAAFFEEEAAQARLRAVFGTDTEAVAREMDFASRMAERYGQDLNRLERQYSKFLVVSNQAGNELDVTRFIFEQTAAAATTMRLSTDELEGALRAFEQIISKGKVQAEELRNQLGDRFPGSVQLMAKALGVSTQELDKMLEQGQLTSDVLLEFALQLRKEFGGSALQSAMGTFRAEVNRVGNDVTELRRVFGRTAAEELLEPMRELREILSSPEAEEGVRALGRALGTAAEAALFLVRHADELLLVLKAIIGFKIAQVFYGIARSLVAFTRQARAATGAMRGLNAAFVLLFLALQTYNIASYIHDQFPEVQKFLATLIGLTKKATATIKFVFKTVAEDAKQLLKNPLDFIRQEIADYLKWVAGLVEWIPAVGDDIAAAYRGAADFAEGDSDASDEIRARLQAIRDAYTEELQGIDDEVAAVFREIDKEFADAPRPGQDDSDAEARAARLARAQELAAQKERERLRQEDADAREQLAEDVAKRLERIDRQIAEREAETLDDRLGLIRDEYNKLIADLRTLGDASGIETVERLIELRQQAERQDFNTERLTQAEEELNEQIRLRETLLNNVNLQRENDLITTLQAKEQIAAIDERMLPTIREQAEKAKELAKALGDPQMVANIENLVLGLEKAKNQLFSAAQLNERFASGLTRATSTAAEGFIRAAEGAQSLGDAFKNAGDAFRQFASDFLRRIADMILQQIILNSLQSMNFGGAVGGALNALTAHEGAHVGYSGGTIRRVDPAWFASAQRYHSGGLPGLKANEVPAILQKGEEVITAQDPRHRNNAQGSNNRLEMQLGLDEGIILRALRSREGEKAIVQTIGRNRRTVRQELG